MIVRVSLGRGADVLDRHQDLVTALDRALKLAHSSSRAHNIAQHLVSAQIFSHDLGLDAERDAAKAAGFACTRELTAGVELANQLAHSLAAARDEDIKRSIARVRVPGGNRIAALSRELARARELDIARKIDSARALVDEIQSCRKLLQRLVQAADGPGREVAATRGGVSPFAVHTAGMAARLLPSTDRRRYSEEYQSELYELAETRPRRVQWVHSTRLLMSAPRLRFALRRPKRETV